MKRSKKILSICLTICIAITIVAATMSVNAAPSYTAVTDWESYAVGAAGRQQIGILGSNTHTWTINPAIAGTDGVPGGGAGGSKVLLLDNSGGAACENYTLELTKPAGVDFTEATALRFWVSTDSSAPISSVKLHLFAGGSKASQTLVSPVSGQITQAGGWMEYPLDNTQGKWSDNNYNDGNNYAARDITADDIAAIESIRLVLTVPASVKVYLDNVEMAKDDGGAAEETTEGTTEGTTEAGPAVYPQSLNVKTEGAQALSPFTNRTYELEFIDDFTGTALNTNNWNYDRKNSNTSEWQSYQEKNVTVENGKLVITVKKEDTLYPAYSGGSGGGQYYKDTYYTSGKINTMNKVNFVYGMIEMYGKAPSGQGVWPAFWTLGQHHGWPYGGEIDIFEMVGGGTIWGATNRDGEYGITVHWTPPNATAPWAGGPQPYHWGIGTFHLPGQSQGAQLRDEYHLYGVEWDEDEIIGYIDNVKFASIPISLDSDVPWPDSSISQSDVEKMIQSMSVAFHKEHYMILNMALGGDWAMGTSGNVSWDSNVPGEGYNHVDTNLPMDFQVDWVKVWQLAE